MRSPYTYRTASKRDAGHLAVSFIELAIKSVTAGVYRFKQSIFIVAVCAYLRGYIFLYCAEERGSGAKASFRVVVWSLGVS